MNTASRNNFFWQEKHPLNVTLSIEEVTLSIIIDDYNG